MPSGTSGHGGFSSVILIAVVTVVLLTLVVLSSAVYSRLYAGTSQLEDSKQTTPLSTSIATSTVSIVAVYPTTSVEIVTSTAVFPGTHTVTRTHSVTSTGTTTATETINETTVVTATMTVFTATNGPTEVVVSGNATTSEYNGNCGGGFYPVGVFFSTDLQNYTASFQLYQGYPSGKFSVSVPNNNQYNIFMQFSNYCDPSNTIRYCQTGTLNLFTNSSTCALDIACCDE